MFEDGRVLFDMRLVRYSATESHPSRRCFNFFPQSTAALQQHAIHRATITICSNACSAGTLLGAKVDGVRSAMDLEHSSDPLTFADAFCAERRLMLSEAESSATIGGILTLGILWLSYCRESDARRHFGGLIVVGPQGMPAHHCRTHGLVQSCRSRFPTLHSR